MRPKSEIYIPKRDDEHPHPFNMWSPPTPGSRVYKGKQRNKLRKSASFFGTKQFANAAAVLMLTYDDNQKATKAHCRLAFSAQPQRFFLPLLVGLHGSTDTTARKSAIEEKMF